MWRSRSIAPLRARIRNPIPLGRSAMPTTIAKRQIEPAVYAR
jgi:hypothetical protein